MQVPTPEHYFKQTYELYDFSNYMPLYKSDMELDYLKNDYNFLFNAFRVPVSNSIVTLNRAKELEP